MIEINKNVFCLYLTFKRKGALSKNKKGTPLFIAKSWGARARSAPPVPRSM